MKKDDIRLQANDLIILYSFEDIYEINKVIKQKRNNSKRVEIAENKEIQNSKKDQISVLLNGPKYLDIENFLVDSKKIKPL